MKKNSVESFGFVLATSLYIKVKNYHEILFSPNNILYLNYNPEFKVIFLNWGIYWLVFKWDL